MVWQRIWMSKVGQELSCKWIPPRMAASRRSSAGEGEQRQSKFRTPVFTALVVLALFGAGVFGRHYCFAHTVPPDDLARIKVGMDWTTAKKILNTHKDPVSQPDGTYFVAFRKQDRWCMVDLTLDSHLRIQSIFHDH